jgi:hypothetical protein
MPKPCSRRRVLRVALAIVCACFRLPEAGAQTLSGVLLFEDGRVPAAGVLVQASNALTAAPVARVRTGSDGTFRLQIGLDSVEVRALRVGSRPVLLAALRLDRDVVRTDRFVLRDEPVELPARGTLARTRCDAGSAAEARVATSLFGQILAAFASPTRGEGNAESRLRMRRVAWTADEGSKLSDRARDSIGTWPLRLTSRTADELFERGFVNTSPSRGAVYLAPSPEFLTAERFVEEYCLFYAGEDPQDAELVGVGFAPAPGRRRGAQVSGTFWIRRNPVRLERMTFAYVGLPAEEMSGSPGGWMQFTALRDGAWTPSAWEIRMPQVKERTTLSRRNARDAINSATQRELGGIIVVSGRLLEIVRNGEAESVP